MEAGCREMLRIFNMAREKALEHVSIYLDFPYNDFSKVDAVLERVQGVGENQMTSQHIKDALAEADKRLERIPSDCMEQARILFTTLGWENLEPDEMLTKVEIVREHKMWKLIFVERRQRRYAWTQYNPEVILPLNSDDALDILNCVLNDLKIVAEY